MRFRICTALFLIVSLTPAAELPVRTVVLYKHGIGFFERGGTLGAGESARLEFKADDMNDVLKSLTINEGGGSAVKGLRYDSSIPLDAKLKEFPFHLESAQPLTDVIDQLKGSRLEVEMGAQRISGAIVSGRTVPGDKDHQERQQVTLLLDSGDIRMLDLGAATGVRFTDSKLQLQFRDLLAALTGARSLDKRSLYIDSSDNKAREIRATYITRMPAWKSSYRLLLDASAQSQLEGWAIVDNTTGEDWTNIRISLISGRPISFISQLYEPKYIARRSADLPENEAIAPTLYGAAMSKDAPAPAPAAPRAMMRAANGGNAGGVLGGVIGGYSDSVSTAAGIVMSNVASTASAGELADLFEYAIRNPVTVKKNESAMLPFLQEKVNARKLVIYSDNSRPNPLNAAEITNATGKTLDGGPITVYDGGAYAGEALVETIKSGDKRLISYGVDLGTRIVVKPGSSSRIECQITAKRGVITTKTAQVDKTVYTIKNIDAKAKTLIIERPIRSNFTLIDTAKPVESTNSMNRFEIKLAANSQVEFPVTEEFVYDSTTSISNIGNDSLLVYVRNTKLSENARKQIQGILDVKEKIAALDAESKRLGGEVSTMTQDEERLRQNIASLSNVSGQQQIVQQYAARLSSNETAISSKTERITQIGVERQTLQRDLDNKVNSLEF